MNRKTQWFLTNLRGVWPYLAVMFLVLGLGFYHVFMWITVPLDLTGDMIRYNAMANHMAYAGYLGFGSKPDAYVTPGYPIVIALFYKSLTTFYGSRLTSIQSIHAFLMFQQILTLLVPIESFLIGRISRGPKTGLAAAILSASYLPNQYVGYTLLTEAIFVPALLLTLLCIMIAHRSQKPVWYAVSGVVLGYTILVRPIAAVILPVWLLVQWEASRNWSLTTGQYTRSIRIAFLLGGVMIVMTPWWIRNAVLFHRFIPFSTEYGNPFLLGADPYFQIGSYRLLALARQSHQGLLDFAVRHLLHGFTSHFWLYVGWYTVGRVPYFFGKPWLAWTFADSQLFFLYYHVLCVMGAIATILSLFLKPYRTIALSTMAIILAQWIFLPTGRYMYPVVNIWCVLVPIVLVEWWGGVRQNK